MICKDCANRDDNHQIHCKAKRNKLLRSCFQTCPMFTPVLKIEEIKDLSYTDINKMVHEVCIRYEDYLRKTIVFCKDCRYANWCKQEIVYKGLWRADGEPFVEEITYCSGGRRKQDD